MKIKLLAFTMLLSALSFSQSIADFTSIPNTNFTLLTPVSDSQHDSFGANATWTFTGLTESETTVDTYTPPTSQETITYPGTTDVLSVTTLGDIPNTKKFFIKETGANTSITAISEGEIVLNYSGTNAFIGTFPMDYEEANSTPVSGTFIYTDGATNINGTFSGTVNSIVDAYGTLNYGDYSQPTTRLRVYQNLTLSVLPAFPVAGTFTQNNYYYYNNTTNNIDCRYTTSTLVSIPLSVNDTKKTLEFKPASLSTNDYNLASAISIYPNPANDFIRITMPNNETIKTLKIINNQGKEILSTNENANHLLTKSFQSGFYFLQIETTSGKTAYKKFIKN